MKALTLVYKDPNFISHIKALWKYLLPCYYWGMWNCRNNLIFRDIQANPSHIASNIARYTMFWTGAKDDRLARRLRRAVHNQKLQDIAKENIAGDISDNFSKIPGSGGDLRYCQKFSHYKPPRAHHCRVCKRCVLRMDHHCVWINNCFGHANYKVFLVFVLYAVIACIHSMVLLFGSVVHDMHKDQQQNGGSFRTSYIICGVLLIPPTLALSVLLGWHIYLILHNKTTIEYHEGVRAMWLAEKVGNIYRHPYDLGVYENLVSDQGGRNMMLQ
ncbi:probable protein S-acyltransferase 16 [Asparagus officinalis]|uniref:probable protein S-acyltransferase 16 n=1 Tax=Asparagus officinalis TaxID=4686 RepID=UPI00098E14FC|nr:probable protein S-acyltransferase 16 [Asparagus officinalis]